MEFSCRLGCITLFLGMVVSKKTEFLLLKYRNHLQLLVTAWEIACTTSYKIWEGFDKRWPLIRWSGNTFLIHSTAVLCTFVALQCKCVILSVYGDGEIRERKDCGGWIAGWVWMVCWDCGLHPMNPKKVKTAVTAAIHNSCDHSYLFCQQHVSFWSANQLFQCTILYSQYAGRPKSCMSFRTSHFMVYVLFWCDLLCCGWRWLPLLKNDAKIILSFWLNTVS